MTPTARETIARALAEDLGPGDITSECFTPAEHRSNARIIAVEILRGPDHIAIRTGSDAMLSLRRITIL